MYEDPRIDGWMSGEELEWLFKQAQRMRHIVEVGSWKGKSSHALLSGCPGLVYCVDTWKGSPNERAGAHAEALKHDIYEIFFRNVGHFPNLRPVKAESRDAMGQFAPKSVDMCFIDGSHDYPNVIADIRGWMPKTRLLLCGHDAHQDGVPKAVKDVFRTTKEVGTIWYVWL